MAQVVTNVLRETLNDVFTTQAQSGTTTFAVDMPRFMGVGSGTTNAVITDTVLEAEINRRLFESSPTQPTTLTSKFVAFWSSTNITGNTISELALFTGSPTGDMHARANFDGFLKTGSIEFQATLIVEFN